MTLMTTLVVQSGSSMEVPELSSKRGFILGSGQCRVRVSVYRGSTAEHQAVKHRFSGPAAQSDGADILLLPHRHHRSSNGETLAFCLT